MNGCTSIAVLQECGSGSLNPCTDRSDGVSIPMAVVFQDCYSVVPPVSRETHCHHYMWLRDIDVVSGKPCVKVQRPVGNACPRSVPMIQQASHQAANMTTFVVLLHTLGRES